jgi:bifunctional DNA-binding transcriptional regulator/antitoxin component of YhaV-PrlF toxin-antitoxin module
MGSVKAKVTRNGQVSLPAELRHRWGAGSVLVIDKGDYAIVRPIPEDTIASLRGAHSGPGPTSEKARKAERESEANGRLSRKRRAR